MEINQSEKTGRFICTMRKEKNLTQKELAQSLDVTDKAISKWERGLSCPDISLLIPLAKALDVSTSELLNGERKEGEQPEHTEAIVVEALQYFNRSTKLKFEKFRQVSLIALSATFLIAMLTCIICDFCLTSSLTWSLLVTATLLFSWVMLLPAFKAKGRVIRKLLAAVSIFIIPYLAVLSRLLKLPIVFTLGGSISALSIIGIWCIYVVFHLMPDRKLRAAGLSFLLCIPLSIGINRIIPIFTRQHNPSLSENLVNTFSLLILAAICLGADYVAAHRKG